MELISDVLCFGGQVRRYQHQSTCNSCAMTFTVYLPPEVSADSPAPCVLWLSGLTCSDMNFVEKAGAFRVASKRGLALLIPDTSPRGQEVPDSPDYDLGQGAGFYVDATQEPWKKHFNMYSYLLKELIPQVGEFLPQVDVRPGRLSISGHSMGGHGALTLYLKNPDLFASCSAFAPICHPCDCPWGHKCLGEYLGAENQEQWKQFDAVELLRSQGDSVREKPAILVSQGASDKFLQDQLKPHTLVEAAESVGVPLLYKEIPGYDHSYYFISTFIAEHLKHHADCLKQ